MYEVALSEWGLTPEYLNDVWTEELLALMVDARAKRFARMRPTPSQKQSKQTEEEQLAAAYFQQLITPERR